MYHLIYHNSNCIMPVEFLLGFHTFAHTKNWSIPHHLFLDAYFIFMYMHCNHCHRVTAHLQLKIQRDSKRWTQFRTSIFPELYMVCE
jgi:hypothetical protein